MFNQDSTPIWSLQDSTPLHSTPPLHLLADAEIIDILEKVHVKFCKLLLNLKTSTPIYINGEIGRYPLNIHMQGRFQEFKLGGGRTSKNCAVRREARKFWGISCENSRFYANKADYRISLLPITSNSKSKTVVSKLHCMSNL